MLQHVLVYEETMRVYRAHSARYTRHTGHNMQP